MFEIRAIYPHDYHTCYNRNGSEHLSEVLLREVLHHALDQRALPHLG